MPDILIACDKFKGSLTATQVRDVLAQALPRSRGFLVADGGDGTLDALPPQYTRRSVRVTGPTGTPVEGHIAIDEHTAGDGHSAADGHSAVNRHSAVVEMADLCGLLRLPHGTLRPLDAHSMGLGQGILAAQDAPRIVVGLGGSASTDGGTGLLVGLGARLLDAHGEDVPPGARHLGQIAAVDLSGIPSWLRERDIVVACDVDAPLLGQHGTVAIFGPQKGLQGSAAAQVEEGLARWATLLEEATGRAVRDQPGAGAAGGVGFALLALGARMEPGVELILRETGFAQALTSARLAVTGEGMLDRQTLMGKTVAGVARLARAAQVPVIAVCGSSTLTEEEQRELGVHAVYSLRDLVGSDVQAMRDAAALLGQVGRRIAQEHG